MRAYYNHRNGSQDRANWSLEEAAKQVADVFRSLDHRGFFQRSFGYDCVDSGSTPGRHGTIHMFFFRRTGIRWAGPYFEFVEKADEITLFTLIEFLYDHAAKPNESSGHYHDWNACGWHYDPDKEIFDVPAGQREWREKINDVIDLYGEGYELSPIGEIVRLTQDGIEDLVAASPPEAAGETNVAKINNAVRMFRRGLSSREEQKQAIRQLVDVLEFCRPQVKKELLTEDERDLFNIANNYAIRHHRADQRDEYDGPWLTWLFYLYLSSTHLVLSLVHGVPMAVPLAPRLPLPPTEEVGPGSSDEDIPF
jgi:hypothetical protein